MTKDILRSILTRALFDAASSKHVLAVRVVPHRVRRGAVDRQRRTVRHTGAVVDEPLARLRHITQPRRPSTTKHHHRSAAPASRFLPYAVHLARPQPQWAPTAPKRTTKNGRRASRIWMEGARPSNASAKNVGIAHGFVNSASSKQAVAGTSILHVDFFLKIPSRSLNPRGRHIRARFALQQTLNPLLFVTLVPV